MPSEDWSVTLMLMQTVTAATLEGWNPDGAQATAVLPMAQRLGHVRGSSGNTWRWVGATACVTHPCPYHDLCILLSMYGEATSKIRGLWQQDWEKKRSLTARGGWWGVSARNGSGVWFQPLAWGHFRDSRKAFSCLWRWATAQRRVE